MSHLSYKETASRWKKLGTLGRTWGLKGDCYLKSNHTWSIEAVKELSGTTVLIGEKPEVSGLLSTVLRFKHLSQKNIIAFQNIKTPLELQAYQGKTLWTQALLKVFKNSKNLEKTKDFQPNLLGSSLLDCHGKELGQVKELTFYGASDNLLIENKQGLLLEIPFVDEYFEREEAKKSQVIKLKVTADFFTDLWQAGDKLAHD